MATFTYDFIGATSPAGATGHKGLFGSDLASVPPSADTGVEGSQANYDNVELEDGLTWDNTGAATFYPYKQFRFYAPNPAGSLGSVTGKAVGYGTNVNGNAYRLYVWNFTTLAWELLDSHTGAGSDTLTGSKTASANSYRSSDYVWLATRGPGGITGINTLLDDYVALELAPQVPVDGGFPNELKWRMGAFNPTWNR